MREVLIEEMLTLSPENLNELRVLTQKLIDFRTGEAGAERDRFETVKHRRIPGFTDAALPRWGRVLVTGGTGCVGQVLLSQLQADWPDTDLASVSRRPPPPGTAVAGVRYFQGDVRCYERMASLMSRLRPDLIVHLAAQRDPGVAERAVAETVTTNVAGTTHVLTAAGRCGVGRVVVASTGKAVRLFTSDVYAATKKLVEYQAARLATAYDLAVTATRFTHVVDNSLIGSALRDWIDTDQPICLHAPGVLLPVQSALECYQLLMVAASVAEPDRAAVVALRHLGWPPVSLLDLALDYLADHPLSTSPIRFTGYPPGYEAEAYPGTYDPATAGDFSPLLNCLEAVRAAPAPVLGDSVDHFGLDGDGAEATDMALASLLQACAAKRKDRLVLAGLLRNASITLLHAVLTAPEEVALRRLLRFGARFDPLVPDHAFIHQTVADRVDRL